MSTDRSNEEFVQLLTDSQSRLLAFILSLLPDIEAAQDVLQETNIVLWRKADQFDLESSFLAWACQIARYEVLAWIRDRGRDRLLFDAEFVESLAADAARQADRTGQLSVLLEECLSLCSGKERQLVQQRYAPGGSVQMIAHDCGEPESRISVRLYRIRAKLLECIERKLSAGARQ